MVKFTINITVHSKHFCSVIASISAEDWIQRVDTASATRAWTIAQAIGFVTTALGDSALKWYNALTSRDLNNQDW